MSAQSAITDMISNLDAEIERRAGWLAEFEAEAADRIARDRAWLDNARNDRAELQALIQSAAVPA